MSSTVTLLDDFREFLLCLNARSVRYLVVGGHAVSFHGYPRFTVHIDVVIVPDAPNADALMQALSDFGFGELGLQAGDFTRPTTVALGRAPHQIDIMTYIKGVDIDDAWGRCVEGVLDGVDVHFIAKADLIANKRAVGRPDGDSNATAAGSLAAVDCSAALDPGSPRRAPPPRVRRSARGARRSCRRAFRRLPWRVGPGGKLSSRFPFRRVEVVRVALVSAALCSRVRSGTGDAAARRP